MILRSKRMKIICFAMLLLTLLTHSYGQYSPKIDAKIELHRGIYYDAFVFLNGGKFNITNFKPWESIREIQLSPSKKYLLVWHKPHNSKQLILTTYNIEAKNKINEYSPGYGGDIYWTMDDKIIHTWGCGSDCWNFYIYTANLEPVNMPPLMIDNDPLGGFELSPNREYVIFYSRVGFAFSIVDLKTMTVVKYHEKDNESSIVRLRYIKENEISIVLKNSNGEFEEIFRY